ncbi:MAG: hypothetical protein KTR31_21165 [Myxococcales bacterium]|nr:hypothetical protein [Myxococcales bacterium]
MNKMLKIGSAAVLGVFATVATVNVSQATIFSFYVEDDTGMWDWNVNSGFMNLQGLSGETVFAYDERQCFQHTGPITYDEEDGTTTTVNYQNEWMSCHLIHAKGLFYYPVYFQSDYDANVKGVIKSASGLFLSDPICNRRLGPFNYPKSPSRDADGTTLEFPDSTSVDGDLYPPDGFAQVRVITDCNPT